MQEAETVTVQVAVHPDPTVARLGFDLDHQYLEWCWTPILGPAGVALLRRLAALCRENDHVSRPVATLAEELGVKPATLRRTLDRVESFGFISLPRSGARDLYATVAPLTTRQLDKLPTAVRQAHGRFIDEHLAVITGPTTARLHQLQRNATPPALQR